MYTILPDIEKELFRKFRIKRKFAEGRYSIFLANQFNRDDVIDFLSEIFPEVQSLVTSGTMKKCKSVMKGHIKKLKTGKKEVSTLL